MLKLSKYPPKGFTLIELLVVVLIIGILAAIALPQYQHVVDKSRYAALMDITKAIADANERFYMVNDRYSTNFAELDVDITPNRLSNDGSIAYFDWGDCHLYYQQEVQCTNNTSLNNQLIKLYDLSTSSLRGGLYCTAAGMDENSRYYKVCENVGEFIAAGSCYELGDCGLWVIIGRNNW